MHSATSTTALVVFVPTAIPSCDPSEEEPVTCLPMWDTNPIVQKYLLRFFRSLPCSQWSSYYVPITIVDPIGSIFVNFSILTSFFFLPGVKLDVAGGGGVSGGDGCGSKPLKLPCAAPARGRYICAIMVRSLLQLLVQLHSARASRQSRVTVTLQASPP